MGDRYEQKQNPGAGRVSRILAPLGWVSIYFFSMYVNVVGGQPLGVVDSAAKQTHAYHGVSFMDLARNRV